MSKRAPQVIGEPWDGETRYLIDGMHLADERTVRQFADGFVPRAIKARCIEALSAATGWNMLKPRKVKRTA